MHSLLEKKQNLLAEKQPPRAREAARRLGVSEAEYVALSCPGSATALDALSFSELLLELHRLGEVMVLTRNDTAVMEHYGVYANPQLRHGSVAILNNPDIDLRLRLGQFKWAFAVNENSRLSLQFFDRHGSAVHKIYLTSKSDSQVFSTLLNRFKTECFMPEPEPSVRQFASEEIRLSSEQRRELLTDWQAIDNAHQVNGLLKKHAVTRPQIYQLLEEGAEQLALGSVKALMKSISERKIPVLIFVPNGVVTQIHNGRLHKLVETGPWFNVLDKRFNFHLNLQGVKQAWIVEKPTEQGVTRSVEWFDDGHNPVAMLYLHSDCRADRQMTDAWENALSALERLDGPVTENFVSHGGRR
ncbi:ChuX/HutX family heme-like substrate-binding protein [Thiomicrorhabdus sp.]|uniref:ChuX/HutX family heme-like substrate-binding protein n=1 Tax=Thiomicrorhabdus sp. TaxID=2039724 RepID=UPI0029C97E0B|nr:ChuX/HutX family heme-like substrate-binding protein [Thiomicrorhabdus sp.]